MGRRRKSPGERRKKVTVHLIPEKRGKEVTSQYRLMRQIIDEHHPHLKEAKIALAWRFGKKADADGHMWLGQAKKGSDLDRALHEWDFVILLNHEVWNSSSFKESQMVALLDHELCFPGGTTVCCPQVNQGIGRWYSGKMVAIRTASGDFLSGTPNHPILTDRGWISLSLLKEGDNVIRCGDPEGVAAAVDPHKYQAPAGIEKVARSLGMAFRLVPQAAHDFDPNIADGEVDVVWPGGGLLMALKSAIEQCLHHLDLCGRRAADVLLSGEGHLFEGLGTVLLASPSGMGKLNALSGIANDNGPVALPVASVSRSYAPLDQNPADDLARHAQQLFKRIHGGPGNVSVDKIVGIEVGSFRGHVYNLHTKGEWYIANNVIVHNCHCAVACDTDGNPKKDEQGRTVWRIRKHDLEEFQEVYARHGAWEAGIQAFIRSRTKEADEAAEAKERPLLKVAGEAVEELVETAAKKGVKVSASAG